MSNIGEAAAMSGSAGLSRGSEEAGQVLPDAKFVFDRPGAALVVIDPRNDFLSREAGGLRVGSRAVVLSGYPVVRLKAAPDRVCQLPFHRRRKGNLPHPARGGVTSCGAARSDRAAAMSAGTGTFEPWKP
jgi:hypothetical protein